MECELCPDRETLLIHMLPAWAAGPRKGRRAPGESAPVKRPVPFPRLGKVVRVDLGVERLEMRMARGVREKRARRL